MSQQVITNGGVDVMNPTDTKDKEIHKTAEINAEHVNTQKQSQPQTSQPNVRHIPIFVEGRDEPLYNTNMDTTTVDAPIARPPPPINDIPQPGSIFQRCKDIPVKKIVPEFEESPIGRPATPARTIPINVIHTKTNKNTRPKHQEHHQQPHPHPQKKQPSTPPQQVQPPEQRCSSPRPPPPPVDPITKIQNIQKEVLELMEKVEKYKGGSRKDKEYVYLDEMLTQNLLKLDTIDTEGKENIKAARKEAINCINKCIQVLEAKAETVEKSQPEQIPKENAIQNNDKEEEVVGDKDNKAATPTATSLVNNAEMKEKPPQNSQDSVS